MTEAELTHAIVKALNQIPRAHAWRNNTVWRGHIKSCPDGTPDILGWLPDGRFLAFEVKIGKGKTTDAQERFVEAAKAAGCCAGVVRSLDDALLLVGSARIMPATPKNSA